MNRSGLPRPTFPTNLVGKTVGAAPAAKIVGAAPAAKIGRKLRDDDDDNIFGGADNGDDSSSSSSDEKEVKQKPKPKPKAKAKARAKVAGKRRAREKDSSSDSSGSDGEDAKAVTDKAVADGNPKKAGRKKDAPPASLIEATTALTKAQGRAADSSSIKSQRQAAAARSIWILSFADAEKIFRAFVCSTKPLAALTATGAAASGAASSAVSSTSRAVNEDLDQAFESFPAGRPRESFDMVVEAVDLQLSQLIVAFEKGDDAFADEPTWGNALRQLFEKSPHAVPSNAAHLAARGVLVCDLCSLEGSAALLTTKDTTIGKAISQHAAAGTPHDRFVRNAEAKKGSEGLESTISKVRKNNGSSNSTIAATPQSRASLHTPQSDFLLPAAASCAASFPPLRIWVRAGLERSISTRKLAALYLIMQRDTDAEHGC